MQTAVSSYTDISVITFAFEAGFPLSSRPGVLCYQLFDVGNVNYL